MQEAFRAEIAEKEEKNLSQERRIRDRDKKTKRRQERHSAHLSRLEEKVRERAQEQVARRVERDAQRHQRRMSENTLEKVELLDRATELHKRIDELELAAFDKSEEFAEVEQELMDRIRRLESQVSTGANTQQASRCSCSFPALPRYHRRNHGAHSHLRQAH